MEETKNTQLKLQEEVLAHFELVGTKPGKYRFPGFGELDLTKITLKDARALAKAGFPHLKAKPKEVAEDPTRQQEKPAKK